MTNRSKAILSAAEDIVQYLDEHFAIDVDVYDIAGLINYNDNMKYYLSTKSRVCDYFSDTEDF